MRAPYSAFGKDVLRLTQSLLKKNLVDVVASDAHGTGRRPPVLSAACAEIRRLEGEMLAERLFVRQPHAVLANEAPA